MDHVGVDDGARFETADAANAIPPSQTSIASAGNIGLRHGIQMRDKSGLTSLACHQDAGSAREKYAMCWPPPRRSPHRAVAGRMSAKNAREWASLCCGSAAGTWVYRPSDFRRQIVVAASRAIPGCRVFHRGDPAQSASNATYSWQVPMSPQRIGVIRADLGHRCGAVLRHWALSSIARSQTNAESCRVTSPRGIAQFALGAWEPAHEICGHCWPMRWIAHGLEDPGHPGIAQTGATLLGGGSSDVRSPCSGQRNRNQGRILGVLRTSCPRRHGARSLSGGGQPHCVFLRALRILTASQVKSVRNCRASGFATPAPMCCCNLRSMFAKREWPWGGRVFDRRHHQHNMIHIAPLGGVSGVVCPVVRIAAAAADLFLRPFVVRCAIHRRATKLCRSLREQNPDGVAGLAAGLWMPPGCGFDHGAAPLTCR